MMTTITNIDGNVIFAGEGTVKAVLEQAVAELIDLHGADLRDADLRGADLRWANLYGADLRRADLHGADLYGANLHDADLYGADLTGADLRWADLRGANLPWADLTDADLRRADLRGADLYGADLRDADLRGANLCGANLPWADLRHADLTNADLCGAHLYGANLFKANLRDANFRGADLTGAFLPGVGFRGADLTGAFLYGARSVPARAVAAAVLQARASEQIAELEGANRELQARIADKDARIAKLEADLVEATEVKIAQGPTYEEVQSIENALGEVIDIADVHLCADTGLTSAVIYIRKIGDDGLPMVWNVGTGASPADAVANALEEIARGVTPAGWKRKAAPDGSVVAKRLCSATLSE